MELPPTFSDESRLAYAQYELYAARGLDYELVDLSNPTRTAYFLRFAEAKQDESAIDMACGTGILLRQLQEQGLRVLIGIDCHPYMLQLAKAKTDSTMPIQYIHGDMTRLPTFVRQLCKALPEGPKKVDMITCVSAFTQYLPPTVPERASILRMWAQLLKPQGRLVLDISGQLVANIMATSQTGVISDCHNLCTKAEWEAHAQEIRTLAADAGLNITKMEKTCPAHLFPDMINTLNDRARDRGISFPDTAARQKMAEEWTKGPPNFTWARPESGSWADKMRKEGKQPTMRMISFMVVFQRVA